MTGPVASCLVCGHERMLAIWRDGTDAGVCEMCRDAARGRGMTGPSLDLDALRDAVEEESRQPILGKGHDRQLAIRRRSTIVRDTLAVLALVEEQRARISTLEEALENYGVHHAWCNTPYDGSLCVCGFRAALAGSPAENKEPS